MINVFCEDLEEAVGYVVNLWIQIEGLTNKIYMLIMDMLEFIFPFLRW